jgi:mono/diheme cytochrome c family protein
VVVLGAFASYGQAPTPNPPPSVGASATVAATPAAVRQSGEDPEAVARGAQAYATANCAGCHGATAKGTNIAPDLVRSPVVEDDTKGELIGPILRNGIPDKGMPKPELTEQQISDIAAWLRVQVYGAAMRDTYVYQNTVVGDPAKGGEFFNGAGKCNTCHSVTGDLAGIGAKYDPPALQSRIVSGGANNRGGRGGRGLMSANGSTMADTSPPVITPSTTTITVTLASGEKLTGVPVSVDDFDVAMRDMTGGYHSFARNGAFPKVEIHDPLQAHWEIAKKLSDEDMRNLTAYLLTLK